MKRSRNIQGMTLVELSVGIFVFGLLLAVVFIIFHTGSYALMKGQTEAELLNTLEAVTARLCRSAEKTSPASLSVAPTGQGCAYLVATDPDGQFQFDAVTYAPKWQKYLVTYYDATAQTLNQREVSVLGTPQEAVPVTFETFTGKPMSKAFTQGRAVAVGVRQARFERTPLGQLALEITVSKARGGAAGPSTLTSRTVVTLRN